MWYRMRNRVAHGKTVKNHFVTYGTRRLITCSAAEWSRKPVFEKNIHAQGERELATVRSKLPSENFKS